LAIAAKNLVVFKKLKLNLQVFLTLILSVFDKPEHYRQCRQAVYGVLRKAFNPLMFVITDFA